MGGVDMLHFSPFVRETMKNRQTIKCTTKGPELTIYAATNCHKIVTSDKLTNQNH
jgi:hypothetical protein